MSPRCSVCADLKVDESGEWPFSVGGDSEEAPTLQDIRSSSRKCQTGGCGMLLKSIAKFCPDASDTLQLCLRTNDSFTGAVFGWLRLEHTTMELYITQETQHPIFTAVKHNICRKDLASEGSLSFVRDKLKECIDHHSSCQIPADNMAYMPKRVLDLGVVGNENREVHSRSPVRLIESIDLIGDRTYACLSHRWDSSGRTIITEQATYEKHRTNLRFEDLDLAYQETVYIMRELDIRYLWIDSLCIIQDSTEDWEAESKTMSKVYNRSIFTIARQCDSDTSLRCLPDPSHRVSHPFISPPIYARPIIRHMWEEVGDFPLSERGWVYQERLLSPRTIHFSDQEISWECYELSTCQCGIKVKYGDYYNDSIPKIHHAKALCLKSRTLKPDAAALRQRWRQIVEEYTRLNLTKESGRFHAVQGCAEQIREHLKEADHFGLW